MSWFEEHSANTLHLSVLTLGELRKGIDTLSDSSRKQLLLGWLQTDLPRFFSGRILPIDTRVADRWGRLVAHMGRPLPTIDSLLAATALTHELTLVTRNLRDFDFPGLGTVDPWSG